MPANVSRSRRDSYPRRNPTSHPPHSPRPGYQPLFARLQGLFPNAPSTSSTSAGPSDGDATARPQLPRRPSASAPKFLKVRVLTWNMHDSIPKGDFEELLGAVGPYTPLASTSDSPVFPNLAAEPEHPYHLVVVASQECPSLSGIPMGLGAGFKIIDKDKSSSSNDKDRDREKDKAKERDRDYDKPRSKHKDKEEGHKHRKSVDDSPLPESPMSPHSGWTSAIENWLCNGSGSQSTANLLMTPGEARESPKATKSHSTTEIPQRTASKEARKGPYQLLIKERMMGIYLAVYIHRDLRGSVKGTSRSAVTAGLIGGRVGNKGGVGISINLDGTTLLFMNAHLAAHEGKTPHRLANLAKIKNELTVDDWLDPNDPRIMSEDLTDKFDYTFLCGDLNFRLDISRLHADWLISRQDYAQALAFDQLRGLMERGEGFVGFEEAPIDFPPTFKYDVLRTLKNRKSNRRSIKNWRPGVEKKQQLSEIEERERELARERDGEDRDDDDDDEGEEEDGGEAASVTSSVWTSIHSRANTEVDDEDYFESPPVARQPIDALAAKVAITHAAHKAKTKWLSMVSPSSPLTPSKWTRAKSIGSDLLSPASARDLHSNGNQEPSLYKGSPDLGASPSLLPPSLMRASSVRSSVHSEEEEADGDKGVYDSSAKKRVPSWCDRILWKTTVHPELDIEEVNSGSYRRTRVGQFIAHALRPISTRARSSIGSLDLLPPIPKSPEFLPSPPSSDGEVLDNAAPFSRFVSPAKSLQHSKSIETFPNPERPALPRQQMHAGGVPLRRSLSATPSPQMHAIASSTSNGSPSLPSTPGDVTLTPPPVPPKDHILVPTPTRWRFFPNFLSREPTQDLIPQHERPPTPEPTPAPPRKGDVVCLSYRTLDDRQMRRLEGRSDHRPVIGSYAVYI